MSDDYDSWVDGDIPEEKPTATLKQLQVHKPKIELGNSKTPVVMVETAFLASTASLIWLINYYFPLGSLLRIFFSIPIALAYLRRGRRAAWMSTLVSGLLLSVLMGPTRSILYIIPYGLLGVQLGDFGAGSILVSFYHYGNHNWYDWLFFRFWFLSILLGEDLWIYTINQVTRLADWLFIKLGLLSVPNPLLIQILALGTVILQNLIYLFVVHLVALLILDRLGSPIPRPPQWVQILLDYDDGQ